MPRSPAAWRALAIASALALLLASAGACSLPIGDSGAQTRGGDGQASGDAATSGGAASSGGASEQPSSEATAADALDFSAPLAGEINVSCYDTMQYKSFLDDAAAQFELDNPGVKVNIETFSAMPEIRSSSSGNMAMSRIELTDDPQGRMDYINRTNTALMSGEGADILAFDVLPLTKYASGGQLEDLSAYIDQDPEFDKSLYRANIIDALRYNGGLWLLPLAFSFNYFAYDSVLLPEEVVAGLGTGSSFSLEQLFDMAMPWFDGESKIMNVVDYIQSQGAMSSGMASSLINQRYAEFVDLEANDAHFADGAFEAMLETVKSYAQMGYITQGATGSRDAEAMLGAGMAQATDRLFFKSYNSFNLMNQFNRSASGGGRRQMAYSFAGGTGSGITDDDEIAGMQSDGAGNVPFTYTMAFGINSASGNKQLAWAFIKFLLSDKMQESSALSPSAIPLLRSALETKYKGIMSGAFGPSSRGGGGGLMGAGGFQMSGGGPGEGTPGEGGPSRREPGEGGPGEGAPGDGGTDGEGIPGEGGLAGDDSPGEGAPGDGGQIRGAPGEGEPGKGGPGEVGPGGDEGSDNGGGMAQPFDFVEVELDEEDLAILEKWVNATEELSAQINTYIYRDSTVDDMIRAEVALFFDGTKSAHEVAAALQSKASLYLNE